MELLGSRPPDWLNHIRFFIVPIGNSAISRYLSSIDNSYATLFGSESWQQLCLNSESSQSKADAMEITNRIQRYLHSSGPCTQIPIAEAMVNYKEEDSCQIFVPFISVRRRAACDQIRIINLFRLFNNRMLDWATSMVPNCHWISMNLEPPQILNCQAHRQTQDVNHRRSRQHQHRFRNPWNFRLIIGLCSGLSVMGRRKVRRRVRIRGKTASKARSEIFR